MTNDSKDWRKRPRHRGANSDWREVFFVLYRLHQFKEFGLGEVIEASEKFGLEIQRESLRVKLAQYVRKGILTKPARGKYKISTSGDKYFKLSESMKDKLLADKREDDMDTY